MSWLRTLQERRAGNDPHFIGDGESLEAFAARTTPAAPAAEPVDPEEVAAFEEFMAARNAAKAAELAEQLRTGQLPPAGEVIPGATPEATGA